MIIPMTKKKKTDAEVMQTRDDVQMMQRPTIWPRWPYLPLRNRDREPKGRGLDGVVLGFLIDSEGGKAPPCVVYLGNTFDKSVDRQVEKFDSYEAIVAAGWKVD